VKDKISPQKGDNMKELKKCEFANGIVYALKTEDGFPIETTDTFLPYYTKNAKDNKTNILVNRDFGDRSERWMVGVSTMSGCNVGCKFCATGKLKKFRKLTAQEIVDQVEFVLAQNPDFKFTEAKEHKINYTRMGEPFFNIEAVKQAIQEIDKRYPGTHHYISTIGVKGSDFSWIKGNITLQVSLHSLDEDRRDDLIPIRGKMTIEELGQIRTESNLKTTVNMTLVDMKDFDIEKLKTYFDKDKFFIKVSPINPNATSEENGLGNGVIEGVNLA
jgi:23S rRNA (adenine2503-C2)-methyltransferase